MAPDGHKHDGPEDKSSRLRPFSVPGRQGGPERLLLEDRRLAQSRRGLVRTQQTTASAFFQGVRLTGRSNNLNLSSNPTGPASRPATLETTRRAIERALGTRPPIDTGATHGYGVNRPVEVIHPLSVQEGVNSE